jgi:CheY-like chemotaxis protein
MDAHGSSHGGWDPGGSHTILVVEDEDAVRALVQEILADGGYRILEARNGAEGLEIARQHDGPIHLVVTDVMMPELSGPELVRRLRRERPGVPVLYISGYVGNHALCDDAPGGAVFLRKPFNTVDLARTVRDMLEGRGGPGSAEIP